MSESSNQNRNKPGKGSQERSQLKVFFIWIALFAAATLVWYQADTVKTNRISIEDLKDQSPQGMVKSGKIQSGKIQTGGEPGYFIVTGVFSSNNDPEAAVSTFQADGLLDTEDLKFLTSTRLFEYQKQNTLLPVLGSLIPFILVFGLLYFLFVRQLRQAGRGALNFGKSKAKLLTRDKDKITFANVAGCDEAKEEVGEVVDFLRDPKKFQRMGGRIPKGILMVGPPGTGKTLLAKAVAGEADVPFFSISGSDFVEMFVGVGASRVRDMFEQGRKSAPCIIFIDEIDAVGRQRGAGVGGGNDEREQTLNSLLVEMDGFDTTEGVIILASTNRPDILDSALLRPGRFDRQVTIDLPDYKGRAEILKVHAKKIKLSEDVSLDAIGAVTPGFSGADLANLLNEAALTAARKNKNLVERIDIDEARDKISFGRERRRLMDDEDKRSTAFHEAGHALVRALLKDKNYRLHKVTILPRGQALGMAMFAPIKDILGMSLNQLRNMITVAMAGRIAEEIETGDFSSGASADIKQATKIARRMVCDLGMSELGPVAYGDNQEHLFLGREINKTQNYSEVTATKIDEEISKIVNGEYARAKDLITEHRAALDVIAEALLKYETIEGKHVDEVIEFGEIRSEVVSSKTEIESAEKAATEVKKTKKATKAEDLPPSVDGAQALA